MFFYVKIVIGNPGLGGFYTDFMQTLYNNLDSKIPIWCISHAGHYDLPGVLPLQGKSLKSDNKLKIKHQYDKNIMD